jgi:hypothetical protein
MEEKLQLIKKLKSVNTKLEDIIERTDDKNIKRELLELFKEIKEI